MAKKNSTKKALIASIIALCMCFSMLIGTTFAWFTDSVTSNGNVIQSGKLKVGMYWAEGTKNPADDSAWTDASKGAIFNNTLWEPGYSETKHIKIVNEGTLALRYKLAIIPHGEVSELADVIDVYYVVGATQIDDRTDLDSHYIGNLRSLINEGIAVGSLAKETEYSATIVLKMKTSAGNEYQNLSIGSDFSIQLLATQVTAEKDSFDENYDINAYYTVSNYAEFVAAVNNAIDTTTIFVQPGDYVFEGDTFVIEGKSITVAGLGVVNFKKADNANKHMFTIQEANDPEADTVVTFKNINFDGNNAKNTRGNIFMVKYNVTLNLENVITKNAASSDICIDNANPLNDGNFYDGLTSTVNLKNADVEKVSMDTIPVVPSHVYHPDNPENCPKVPDGFKTYAYLWFDATSSVGIIEKQSISADASTMYVNGDNSDTTGFYFYANDDASLKAVLDTIHTESKYYGKKVTVKLAAGEYSGDYVINQYPKWNGVSGTGSGNNYAAGVPVDAPTLNITIVGTAQTTFSRGMTVTPATVFTGSFTVNGFGNSNTGFGTTDANPAYVNLKTLAFDGKNLPTGGDVIVFQALNAVDNLNIDGCYFANATHVIVGGTGNNPHIADDVTINNCSFENGCLISGRAHTLNVKNCTAREAHYGFINSQNAATINVDNCDVECSEYFLRTNNSDVVLNVTNTRIVQTDNGAPKGSGLVVYRGSGHKATFTNCDMTYGTLKGNTGTGEIYFVTDEGGVKLVEDALNNTTTLGKVSPEITGTFTVPAGVDALGSGAFTGSNVTTVIIPASVTDFGGNPNADGTDASGGAFKNSAVEKIVLPDGITEIPAAAFNQATKLKEINIPSSVTTIGINAFAYTGFTELVIPATVTNIGYGAFRGVQASVIHVYGNPVIENYAFRSCPNLTDIYFHGDNVVFTGTSQVICRKDSGEDQNLITVHVQNQVIANRIDVANSTTKGHTYKIKNKNTDTDVYVSNDAELLAALKEITAKKGAETTIHLLPGTYANDINLTVAELGEAKCTAINFVATEEHKVVFAGTTTLGLYVNKTTNVACYNANITFDGITFDHAEAKKHSLDVQNIASLYVVNCTIIGDAEYGVGSASGNPIANECKFEKCNFKNAGMQLYGNFSSNIVIDTCEFVESVVNVGTGGANGPEIKNSEFTVTLTNAHNGESFYVIRSAGTGANTTVTNCDITLNSTVDGVGVAGSKGWGVFVTLGSFSITAEDVRITMTDAALAQPALKVASIKSGVAGKIIMTNVTVNGMTYVSNNEELAAAIQNAADGDEICLMNGTYEVGFSNNTAFNVDNLTITGLGDVKLNVTSTEVTGGRIQGNNVTFNNIDFSGVSKVWATGNVTYNKCVFQRLDASNGNANAYVNNCVIKQDVHTEPGMNGGNVYVTNSKVAKAEYNADQNQSTFSFTDCEIGDIIIWGDASTTILNNCTYGNIDKHSATTTLIIDGALVVTPEALAILTIESNKTYNLVGDFGGQNVSLVMPAGVENVIFDGSKATNINELIITQNGQLVDNKSTFMKDGELLARSGNVTVQNFTVLSQINVFACNTEVVVEKNTAEALMIYAANCDIKVLGNTIDANFEAHPTYQNATTVWNTNKYGIMLNIFHYDLWLEGNTVTDSISHAVGINGGENWSGFGIDADNEIKSFTGNKITVNAENDTNRAAFKVWDDATYARKEEPSEVSATAQTLIDAILADDSNVFTITDGHGHTNFCFYNVNTNN